MLDPASVDVLLLYNLEIDEALFLNLAQVRSYQLEPLMRGNSIIPTSILYILDDNVLSEERLTETEIASRVRSELTGTNAGREYMEAFAPEARISATSFMMGEKRLISHVPLAKWLERTCDGQNLNLDSVKWELLMEKPLAQSETQVADFCSTGE